MRIHYKGKYNDNPDSLPNTNHRPGAVPFKEAADAAYMSIIIKKINLLILFILSMLLFIRYRTIIFDTSESVVFWSIGLMAFICSFILIPVHWLLRACCFKEDVYLYTNFSRGLVFVVSSESMSKKRFIFMCLMPNIVLGLIPYLLGMIDPSFLFFGILGTILLPMGSGDYYNMFNALTQMPKGARTYLYQFNSYWYIPKNKFDT